MTRPSRLIGWGVALSVSIGADAAGAAVDLVDAVKQGDLTTVQALLEEQVDVNAAEADGSTPLHWAAHGNEAQIANRLIRAGADADAANRYGVRPLWLACVNGNAAIVQMLLEAGADPNTVLTEGETPLMMASRTGIVEAVDALLAHGADANATETWRGQTALMWAAAEGHADVVQALIEAGADVKATSSREFTPLLFAAREGRIGAVRALLDGGSTLDESLSVNSRRSAGGVEQGQRQPSLDAFLLAGENAHFELAALLLERGADPNHAPRGWTALHQVSWVRKTGEVGGNDPPPDGSGDTGSLEFVRTLVEHGADVNARVTTRKPPVGASRLDFHGATPFWMAARGADLDLMRLLLELGADPLTPSEDYTTPLMVAAGVGTSLPGEEPGTEREALEAVKMTLELGGDLNMVDAKGDTAMHGAAYKHLPAVAQFLGDAGASVEIWNQQNEAGYTPLDIAAGIQRGMNFVFSAETEAVIRQLLSRAGVTPTTGQP